MIDFYHISNGVIDKYFYDIDNYMNENIKNENVIFPVVTDINIITNYLSIFSKRKNVDIEVCNSVPVRIFAKLTNYFVFDVMKGLCKILFDKGECFQDDRDIVYPYRLIYNNPKKNKDNIKYTDKYIKNYKKSIISFRIATFYGFNILIEENDFQNYVNNQIYENQNYVIPFKTVEELDLKNLISVYTKKALYTRLIDLNPYLDTQKIISYTNDKNLKYIKKLYNIESIDEVETEDFYHKLNRYPFFDDKFDKNISDKKNKQPRDTGERVSGELTKKRGFNVKNIQEIKNILSERSRNAWDIYTNKPIRNETTNSVIKYHNVVMNYYIKKYFAKDNLLDIGAGPVRQISFYEKIGIKRVVAIEPSQDSIDRGIENFNKYTKTIKLDFIEGVGDENWNDQSKYKPVIKYAPYKSILFKFTIHYMLNNMKILMQNVKNVSERGTIVIVSCLDGTKIMEKLKEDGKYEIMQNGEVIYGVYDFDDETNETNKVLNDNFRQIMVYFRGVYGVDSGSIEYIVNLDYLINQFKSIGFEVLTSNNFMNINNEELRKINQDYNNAQKKISELHHVIVFRKL